MAYETLLFEVSGFRVCTNDAGVMFQTVGTLSMDRERVETLVSVLSSWLETGIADGKLRRVVQVDRPALTIKITGRAFPPVHSNDVTTALKRAGR